MTTIHAENPFPSVPHPAGAITVYEWEDPRPFCAALPNRYFVGTRRQAGRVEILIDGTQWSDGRTELSLTVHGVDCDENMPTDTARNVAAALIEAADEIDQVDH
jgi:hypothetical protein